jgi:D-alanyl-D-alanine carboxypeptidase
VKRLLVAVLAAFCLPGGAWAAAPPAVDARAFIVERANGDVLAEENADAQLPIASITKLMNVLLTLEKARLGSAVTVPYEATTVDGSVAGLQAGQQVTVRQLLEEALIPSANDAADTLAYHLGNGSQAAFVAQMNAHARGLDLRQTHFVRPEGLDPGDVSSARDVTKLARILMRRPVFRSIVRETSTTLDGRVLETRNNLLTSFPGVLGVKTGHTSTAGWGEVAAARRNGVTIYATVLGSPDEATRDAALTTLLDWGLSRYRPAVIAAPNRTYAQAETGFGRGPVALVAGRRVVRPVRVGRPLVERVVAESAASLPVRQGSPLGQLRVYQGSRLVASSPLVAARSVSGPSLPGRVGWYIGRMFTNLFTGL